MLSRRSRALLACARAARPAASSACALRPSLAAAALHAQAQSEARSPWSAAGWAAAGVLAAGVALLPDVAQAEAAPSGGLVSHEAKLRTFYEYERRLRALSSPDKVRRPACPPRVHAPSGPRSRLHLPPRSSNTLRVPKGATRP